MFLAIPLMLAAAAATPVTDPVGAGRKAFSKCLSDQIQVGLDKKIPLAEFPAALKKACGDKEATYRAAIIADDTSTGMSAADSEADATDQITEYYTTVTSDYEGYKSTP